MTHLLSQNSPPPCPFSSLQAKPSTFDVGLGSGTASYWRFSGFLQYLTDQSETSRSRHPPSRTPRTRNPIWTAAPESTRLQDRSGSAGNTPHRQGLQDRNRRAGNTSQKKYRRQKCPLSVSGLVTSQPAMYGLSRSTRLYKWRGCLYSGIEHLGQSIGALNPRGNTSPVGWACGAWAMTS